MSASDQLKIQHILQQCQFYLANLEEDETYLEQAHKCLAQMRDIVESDTRGNVYTLEGEILVRFAEIALNAKTKDEDAKRYLELFFQRVEGENQFYCRALLAQATVEARFIEADGCMGEEKVERMRKSFQAVERALAIMTRPENKQKYQFLIYNASVTTWHLMRPFMRAGWAKAVAEIVERVSNLLEETDDSDHNWRCRYMTALFQSLLDAEKKPEALKLLDKVWETTKKKGECQFQESLFRLRLHAYRDNAGSVGGLKKEAETGDDSKRQWKPLHTLQAIKSGAIPEAQVEKEIQTMLASIAPDALDPAAPGGKLSHILQERVAEAGRVALHHQLAAIAEGCVGSVARCRTSSLRGKIWSEYTKAELLLLPRHEDERHPKTGMKLNAVQKQMKVYERKVEALKMLERTMLANKRLNDADLISEGSALIWNIAMPLLRSSARSVLYKPLLSAANMLELIGSTETRLRVQLHLELAKCEMAQDFLSKAEAQLRKALKLDYSLVRAKIGEDDSPKPLDKYMNFMLQKLELRQNIYGKPPDTVMEQVVLDVENALHAKNPKMRETLLEQTLSALQNYKEPEMIPGDGFVEEEVKEQQQKWLTKMERERKNRVLLGTEVAKLCLQDGLIQMAIDAAQVATAAEPQPQDWKPQQEAELLVAYSESHFVLAESYSELVAEEEVELAFQDIMFESQEERDFSPELRERLESWRVGFVKHVQMGVKAAMAINQAWLVFNGSILFWNNYLTVFKKSNFPEIIFSEALPAMQECFESMNNCLSNYEYPTGFEDFFSDRKLSLFSNLGYSLARLHEKNGKNDEALRICDIQLQKPLPASLKKSFDTIRARITKSAAQAAKPAAGGKAPAKPAAGGEPVNPNDAILSEVVGMLELISNTKDEGPAGELVKKAVDVLRSWKPNPLQEADLEMHAELWAKLGRLACTIGSNLMLKMSLVCAETSFKGVKEEEAAAAPKKKQKNWARQVPSTRLRWYSVAQGLYGEVLSKLVNEERQEKDSQERLLFASVTHFIEAGKLATQAGLSWLLLENTKCMWNAVLPLLDTQYNRRKLIEPLATTAGYLAIMKENNDPDFLVLIYSALFACITEHKQWKLGEQVVNQAFDYVPSTHQRPLWEAKMLYYSKLGKNVLSAIANMKETNASLQAKVWVKLARSAANKIDQYAAYQKAIQILRKDGSVEAADVLLQFAEWLHRKGYPTVDAEDQLLMAVDIMMEIEPGWEDEDEEEEPGEEGKTKKSSQSRSSVSKSRKSKASQSAKSKSKTAKTARTGKTGKTGRSSRSRAKSKKQKSMMSSRSRKTKTKLSMLNQEEEAQPDFLNCTHFDRLFRAHVMLSMIAPDSDKQKQYLLDAFYFLNRIWQQSFITSAAMDFVEAHRDELAAADVNFKDPDSKAQFFAELFLTPQIAQQVTQNAPAAPKSSEDWLRFSLEGESEFHKNLANRIRNSEDRTIMCLVSIPKPELTYEYMCIMLRYFEELYLHQQMLPLLKTMEIFSQLLLQSEGLTRINMLKLARLMRNLGLVEESEKEKERAGKFSISEDERKLAFEKIKGLADPNDDLNQAVRRAHFYTDPDAPFTLGTMRVHQVWLLQAQELLNWGELDDAKNLATEAALHARVLKEQRVYARAMHLLAHLHYLAGEFNPALRFDMQCQSLADDPELLEASLLQTTLHLSDAKRADDAEVLLTRSVELFEAQLADQSQNFNRLNLVFLLESMLLQTCLFYQEQSSLSGYTLQQAASFLQTAFHYQERFTKLREKYGYREKHLIQLLHFAAQLHKAAGTEGPLSGDKASLEFLEKKLQKCGLVLLEVQKLLSQQFYFLGLSLQKSEALSLPLSRLLGVVKVRVAQINATIGITKSRMKDLVAAQKKQSQTLGHSYSKHSIRSKQHGDTSSSDMAERLQQAHNGWMEHISRQIDAMNQPASKHFNRFEKSISMIQSALNLLHPESQDYLEALVELGRSKRLLADNKKHLRGVWKPNAVAIDRYHRKMLKMLRGEEVPGPKEKAQSIVAGEEEKEEEEEKDDDNWELDLLEEDKVEYTDINLDFKAEAIKELLNFTQLRQGSAISLLAQAYPGCEIVAPATNSKIIAAKGSGDKGGSQKGAAVGAPPSSLGVFALEFAQARGNVQREQAFYYLSLYQFAQTRNFLHTVYSEAIGPGHPDNLALRKQKHLNRSFTSPLQFPSSLDSLPWNVITQHFSLNQVREILPQSSACIMLQMSPDKQDIYFGYINTKKDKEDETRDMEFGELQKIPVSASILEKMQSIQERVRQLKHTLFKTPCTALQDLDALMNDGNQKYEQILAETEHIFRPITQRLDLLINPELPDAAMSQRESELAPTGKAAPPKKEEKKAPKDAKKGASTGQLAKYESNLPLPNSDIESVVILLDWRLSDLPIDGLAVFEKVPVVTRDFSLHHYVQRLKRVGHVAGVHNNQGCSKEQTRFISDIPKDQLFSKQLHELEQKQRPNAQGVLTDAHIPSLGEWQRLIYESHLFSFWGLSCMLHLFPPQQLAKLGAFSRCRAMLVLDRMNALKVLVDRNSLLSPHYQLAEQPLQIAALATLIGVNFVMLNQFAMRPEETIAQYEQIAAECMKEGGVYLGAGLRKYKEPIPIYEVKKVEPPVSEEPPKEEPPAGKKGAAAGKKGAPKGKEVKEEQPVEEEREIVGYSERATLYKGNAVQYGVGLLRVV